MCHNFTLPCRFLLVEHLTAEILSQSREQETRERLMSIALACRHHRSFLKRLQHFALLPPVASAVVARLEDGEAASPQVARTEKLELRKQETALRRDISQLRGGTAPRDDSNAGVSTAGALVLRAYVHNCSFEPCAIAPFQSKSREAPC